MIIFSYISNAENVSMVFAFEMSALLVTEHFGFLCC